MYSISNIDFAGKRALVRLDLNVPMSDGKILNDTRIQAGLPTINALANAGAKVLLISHLEHHDNNGNTATASLSPIGHRLEALLQRPVRFVSDWLNGVSLANGEIALAENVRHLVGEKTNEKELAKRMAALSDVFVMDAFSSSHRAHASTCGVAHYTPIACAGLSLLKELQTLERIRESAARPLTAVVGGAKILNKLSTLRSLCRFCDHLLLGGGIANTFLAARSHFIGQSLYDPNCIAQVHAILQSATEHGCRVEWPTDVVVANADTVQLRSISAIKPGDKIMDVGSNTVATYSAIINASETIIWSGPLGVFELPAFAKGTSAIATAIADSKGFSVGGGGDTLTAIDYFGIADRINYISTGGGAFLSYLANEPLPAITVLQDRYAAASEMQPIIA